MRGKRPLVDWVEHRYAQGAKDVRLVTASFRSHRFVPHVHSEYAIAVPTRGVEAVRYRGAEERTGSGGLLLLDADVVHAGRPAGPEGWDYRVFYVPPELLAEISGQNPTFPVANPYDPELARRLAQVHRLQWDPANSPLLAIEQILQALGLLLSRHSARGPVEPRELLPGALRTVQRYLADDITRTPRLEELAGLIGLPRFALVRAFRAATGVTPHGYLLALRLRHAQQLLTAGHSVGRAAADSGFHDQAHLHRHFRRAFAATPGQFARVGRARNNVQDRAATRP
ncbi:AraC family transcriptional regulator [Mycobacterium heidelbergense]|uniref:AraC family transcriptional regulator n=1 Tax=Mycobacterium heidelbergense TaxID=53376 RepID=UPI003CEC2178